MLVPEIWLRRGLTYAFRVNGGNNPHMAEFYHPLIITDEPNGGFDKLTDDQQSKIRVLAGIEYSRRGRPRPTSGTLLSNTILNIWSPCFTLLLCLFQLALCVLPVMLTKQIED